MATFTLGLDLDGVVGDYVVEFRRHVSRALGVPETELPDPHTWSFVESWPVIRDHEHFMQLHTDAVRDGMFRGLPMMKGASEALWRLSDNDVYIRVVTHRLLGKGMHMTAASDTVAWLDRHNIPYRDLCFVGQKSQVGANVYIDDAPHNIQALQEAGAEVIIFDAPYNRDAVGPRARNWDEAAQMILDRQARWAAEQ